MKSIICFLFIIAFLIGILLAAIITIKEVRIGLLISFLATLIVIILIYAIYLIIQYMKNKKSK